MIRKNFVFFILVFLAGFIFIKCRKPGVISSIPSIKYAGYSKVHYPNIPTDSLILIKIDFEDGDGDIGLGLKDSMYPFKIGDPYYYNLFAEYQEHVNGAFSYRVNGADTTNYNDRIVNIQPESRDKSISGTLTIKIIPVSGITLPDSIRLNIFLIDKALHKSNIVSTGAIPVNF